MTKMLFISTGTEKYPQLFDISHVIIASVVSEIRPKARITLPPLLSILKRKGSQQEKKNIERAPKKVEKVKNIVLLTKMRKTRKLEELKERKAKSQACQTSADPRNSAVFDFPRVIFQIRPDLRRNYFSMGGRGRLGAFLRDVQLKMENNVMF